MQELPIHFLEGHLFLELDGDLWLYDTGAPASFGEPDAISLLDTRYAVDDEYMGLTARALSDSTGVQCAGLLGTDILTRFDHIIDCDEKTVAITSGDFECCGKALPLSSFMGIPVLTARIAGQEYRMFFDTGAQFSYFQDESLSDFPACGKVTDFYPGFGLLETDTHLVDVCLDDVAFTLRCGALPGVLGAALMMADTRGIIGNQILLGHVTGYFPRRNLLCL